MIGNIKSTMRRKEDIDMNTMHLTILTWKRNPRNVAGNVRDVCVRKIVENVTPAGRYVKDISYEGVFVCDLI